MHHKPKSIHINILMHGHSSGHHNEKKSQGASSNAKPSDVLMRQHHFHGGIASDAPVYKKGGRAHRKFAEGGHLDFSNIHIPQGSYRRLGGGIDWETRKPLLGYAKGGNVRRRHADGGSAMDEGSEPTNQFVASQYYGKPSGNFRNQGLMRKGGGGCYAEGGSTKEYGEKPLEGQLRTGGRAKRRYRHAEGEAVEGAPVADNSVRQEQRKGGRSKRQHHYWGQNVIGRLPLVGGLANSIANTVGTLDPHKYGGAEYVANTKGKKALDIFSTIGNLGASIAAAKKSGGGVHHKYRQRHAAGGSGKVRKGMMTESGKIIYSKD